MADPSVTMRLKSDTSGLQRGTKEAEAGLDQLKAKAGGARGELGQFAGAANRAERGATGLGAAANRTGNFIRGMIGAAALRQASQYADAYINIQSRLRLVTAGEREYAAARDQSYAIAQRTFSSLESTATLYGRMQTATKSLGRSQADALRTTELINKTFQISGTEAATASAAIIQLSQGLGAGALRGDEFNSVMEGAPRLADALATSLGKTRGELREMAEQGQITADLIIDAILKQGDAIDAEFAQLEVTAGRGWQNILNAATRTIGELSTQVGATKALGLSMQAIAGGIERLPEVTELWVESLRPGLDALGDMLQYVDDFVIKFGGTAPALREFVGELANSGDQSVSIFQRVAEEIAILPISLRTAMTIILGELDQFRITGVEKFDLLLVGAEAVWLGIRQGASLMGSQVKLVIGAALDAVLQRFAGTIDQIAAMAASIGADGMAAELRALSAELQNVAGYEASVRAEIVANQGAYEAERTALENRRTEIQSTASAQRAASADAIQSALAERQAALDRIRAERELAAASEKTGEGTRRNTADTKLDEAARKAQERAIRAQTKALQEQAAALTALDRIIEAGNATSEAMRRAIEENQREMQEFNKIVEVLLRDGPVLEDVQRRIAEAYGLVTAAARDRVQQARQEEDVIGRLTADYAEAVRLAGLSEAQRRIEIGVTQARTEAERTLGRAINDTELAQIRSAVTFGETSLQMAEASRASAEAATQAWRGFVDDSSRAFGDWVARGFSDFSTFVDDIKQAWKRMIADLIAQMVQSGLLKMVAGLFGGGGTLGAGGGFNISSLFGGGGGSGGGLAGYAPYLLAAAGGLYGLQNRGRSTGDLGSLGAGFAYGGAGLAVGTVGLYTAAGAAGAAAAGGGAVAAGAAGGFSAGLAAVPVIGWVALAMAAIDYFSGGKLFGTRYRPESSESTLALGEGGGDASLSLTEVRNRSLFRGRQWRTRDMDAGDEAQQAADQLYDAIYGSMVESARMLAIDTPPMIDAAIRTVTEYDKKGKVKATQIFVDVLGRTWEEASAELAATRLNAEAIISVIEAALDESVSAVAERWRSDAQTLAAGAEFLRLAAADIRTGVGLLGPDGTLGEIADLVEELATGSETLAQTYARLSVSVQMLDAILSVMGTSMDMTRENFVRFADDFVTAAGGMERAQALFNSFWQRFFTEAERAEIGLTRTEQGAAREFQDIGLDLADFRGAGGGAEFRRVFEEIIPTLSAEALVQWLEAADALGMVIDAEEALARARGTSLSEQEAAAEAAAEAERQLIADRTAGIVALEEMMAAIRRENAQLSDFASAWLDAGDWRSEAIAQANAHARAAGLAAAREGDLAQIELRASQMRAQAIAANRAAMQDLAVELGYTQAPDTLDALNARIAELQQGAYDAASAFSAAGDGIGQAVDTMRDQLALLLGDLSPYNDRTKLELARGGLQAGTVTQEQFLTIARRLFGSTDRYRDEFEFAQQFPNAAAAAGPTGGGFNVSGSSRVSSSTDGRSLEDLIAARDELMRAQRASQADDFARRLAEQSAATGDSIDELLAEMGFGLDRLAADLSLTDQQLRDYLGALTTRFSADQAALAAESVTAAIEAQTRALIEAIRGPGAQIKPDWEDIGEGAPLPDGGGSKALLVPIPVAPGSAIEAPAMSREEAAALRAELAAMRAVQERTNALLAEIAGHADRGATAGASTAEGTERVVGEVRRLQRQIEDRGPAKAAF
jgi:tape measure domain-containing protein